MEDLYNRLMGWGALWWIV